MGIGDILREAREEQGYTIDEIQQITKIQKRYLIKIEQNDYSSLPGKFYARAFIKEYANVVGLNVAAILRQFDEDDIETDKDESVRYTRVERTRRTPSSSFVFSILPTFVVILLIIGIIFVAVTLYQRTLGDTPDGGGNQNGDEIIRNVDEQPDNIENNDNDDDENEDNQNFEEEPQSGTESEFKVIEVGEGENTTSTVEFHHVEDELIVELEPIGNVYVDVGGDLEKYYFIDTIDVGHDDIEIDVSEEEHILINMYRAENLIVRINGVELEYPVEEGTVHQRYRVEFVKQ